MDPTFELGPGSKIFLKLKIIEIGFSFQASAYCFRNVPFPSLGSLSWSGGIQTIFSCVASVVLCCIHLGVIYRHIEYTYYTQCETEDFRLLTPVLKLPNCVIILFIDGHFCGARHELGIT